MELITQKIQKIEELIKEINSYNNTFFGNEEPIIYPEPIICSNFTCAEGGFVHTVSWLYLKFFDNKKSQQNINFLLTKIGGYNFPEYDSCKDFIRIIHNIRTYLHHDISKKSKKTQKMKRIVEHWFSYHCSYIIPQTDNEWKSALNKIVNDSLIHFLVFSKCIDEISKDIYLETILIEWEKSIFPFSIFEISIIVKDEAKKMGIKNIDSFTYSQKNFNTWRKELEVYSEINENVLRKFISKKLSNIR